MLLQDSIQISFGSPLRSYSLAEILPQRFGPADLLENADVPLLLQPQSHELHLDPWPASGCEAGTDAAPGAELRRRAVQSALDAARKVRCPSYELDCSMVDSVEAETLRHEHQGACRLHDVESRYTRGSRSVIWVMKGI